MKKAPIAVALVLVFGLFAAAFSLAPAVAQYIPSSTSTGSTGNTTSTTNTTNTSTNATGGETFSARGSIAALIFDMGETTTTSEMQDDTMTTSNDTSMTGNMNTSGNTTTSVGNDTTITMPQIMTGDNASSSSNMTDTGNMTSMDNMTSTSNETSASAKEMKLPYIVAGNWHLDVEDDSVSDFAANFTMVHTDGTGRHMHEMSNFVSSNSSTIDTSGEGSSFIFGTVDVATNGEMAWTGADALIIIEKNNVVSISLATEGTEYHFGGQLIHGIVESMTDENGNEMIDTGTEAAGDTMGNMTETDGTGNVTQGAEDAVNETGEFFGNVTEGISEGIEDLFNGTGQR